MSYTVKEAWIPCDSQVSSSVGPNAETDTAAIKSGTADIPRGLLFGVHVIASAADANNNGVVATTGGLEVRVYSDTDKTLLLYSVFLDMDTANVGSAVHSSDTLATPIPCFETPYFTVRSANGAATLNYTTTFFMRTLA